MKNFIRNDSLSHIWLMLLLPREVSASTLEAEVDRVQLMVAGSINSSKDQVYFDLAGVKPNNNHICGG